MTNSPQFRGSGILEQNLYLNLEPIIFRLLLFLYFQKVRTEIASNQIHQLLRPTLQEQDDRATPPTRSPTSLQPQPGRRRKELETRIIGRRLKIHHRQEIRPHPLRRPQQRQPPHQPTKQPWQLPAHHAKIILLHLAHRETAEGRNNLKLRPRHRPTANRPPPPRKAKQPETER